MYKLLLIVRSGNSDGSAVHQLIIEYQTRAEADTAYRHISNARPEIYSRHIIKLYDSKG